MRPVLHVRSYPPQADTHAHDWHQAVLSVEGRLSMAVGGTRGMVDDRTLVVIPAGQPHSFRGEGENRFAVIDIPSAWNWPHRAAGTPFLPMDDGLRHLTRYLVHDASNYADASLRDRMGALLADALRTRGQPADRPPALDRALDCIHATVPAKLPLARLAAESGVSPRALHVLFRRFLGCPPGRYLAERRLDEAERLIATTRRPLAEIAFDLGFGDQSALTRSLRRHRGVTPGALRRGAVERAQEAARMAKTA